MINLKFPHELCHQIPKSEGRQTVSTAYELYSRLLSFRIKTFSLLAFTWIVFFFFLLFNQRILLLILLTQTRQFRVLFCCGSIVFGECLAFEGKSLPVAVLTFNNSSITRLVALKCGSARELVIYVILISVGKPQPTWVPCFNGWT